MSNGTSYECERDDESNGTHDKPTNVNTNIFYHSVPFDPSFLSHLYLKLHLAYVVETLNSNYMKVMSENIALF